MKNQLYPEATMEIAEKRAALAPEISEALAIDEMKAKEIAI
jgi:hypothetical protein